MKAISFIMPTRDGLRYLKWAYESIRKNCDIMHEICIYDDFSSDGTWEWMNKISKDDNNIQIFRNDGPKRVGHTILYDRLIKYAKNDIVMIFHNDMYACNNLDIEIDKHIKPGVVVSATRIEPPLHPSGPEKIIKDWGIEPEEFDSNSASDFIAKNNYGDKTTEGVFAPWAIYKSDFQSIGGHDALFAPQSKEDSDIFNRFHLNGCKFIQTWKGFVYHLTCRGSRFADGAKRNPDGQVFMVGRETDEWLAQNQRSSRNFIRKWGCYVKHTDLMKPIVPHKYDIALVVDFGSSGITEINQLAQLEIWCNCLYIKHNKFDQKYLIDRYIELEQQNTKFDLIKRIKIFGDIDLINHDIIVEFNWNDLNENNIKFIHQLPEIIADSGEPGILNYDIYKITIDSMKTYENELIKIGE